MRHGVTSVFSSTSFTEFSASRSMTLESEGVIDCSSIFDLFIQRSIRLPLVRRKGKETQYEQIASSPEAVHEILVLREDMAA